MRAISLLRGLVVVAGVLLLQGTAWAQETPRQIQGMIANGQAQAALGQLQGALQAHPTSGVAWYLSAEAQDSLGNAAAARYDLAQADHFAPGLPFARASDVAALRAHVQAAGVGVSHGGHGGGIGMGVILIGGLVLFVLWRLFRRRRYQPGFGGFQGQAPDGRYPYGPGYGPGGGGMAPGAGGSLLSGLAAGAGFAVGERVVDDMMGNRSGGMIDPAQASDQWQSPDRDDGLSGSPGWDAGSNDPGDDFDQGNSW
jgi:hypothetical protein